MSEQIAMKSHINLPFSLFLLVLLTLFHGVVSADTEKPSKQESNGLIERLVLPKTTFNPSIGRKLDLVVVLKKQAKVTIRVYDPDWHEIAIPVVAMPMDAGENTIQWDGKDKEGQIVPDEAYFFTLDATTSDGEQEIYDPTAFSGGVEKDLTQASIDKDTGTIRYRLPKMSRVDIRIGISGGPLLRKVVDWEPRPAGEITDYWDGMDKDNLFDLHQHSNSKMIISYFTLPDNSVITYGNRKLSYLDYIQGKTWPKKEDRTTDWARDKKISLHYRIPRDRDYSPQISMDFPNQVGIEGDTPILKGRSVVHVDLSDDCKESFQNSKFEIVFFLDGTFHAEEETGYAPYNWIWDTAQTKEGTYLLTVNVSSFDDHIGIVSRKVKVVH